LKALVPGLAPSPAAGALKPWARAVITLWVISVVPLLGTMLLLLVLTLPRVVGTALVSAEQQREAFGIAFGNGALVEAAARAVAMVVVALPVLAAATLLASKSPIVSPRWGCGACGWSLSFNPADTGPPGP
jgi:putative peptide zinc metalloprotease protein